MILGHEAEFKQRYLERRAALADKNQADVKITDKPQEIHIYYKIDIDSVLTP